MDGNMYEVRECPLCGALMWNGRCENKDCKYHWIPYDESEDEE